MEQSTALNKLMESADLIKMVEDLTAPGALERLSASSLSGMRITLRNVRDAIVQSHDVLAANALNKARADGKFEAAAEVPKSDLTSQVTTSNPINSNVARAAMTEAQRMQMTRRDLRASLEKIVER